MTGSMYASIAGLKSHMNKLSVIGNNVANVNTAGYKTQRVVFRDAVYRVYTSGSEGTATTGSRNPSEIGYGSQIGSIDIDMSSTTINPGNPTDCAIVGDGFFLVGGKKVAEGIDPADPTSLKSLTLTRVGDFYFGEDGYLVDSQGNCVYGFQATGEVDVNGDAKVYDQLVPIRYPRMQKVPIYNTDGDPTSGIKGYETRVYWPSDKALGAAAATDPSIPLWDREYPLNDAGDAMDTTKEKLPFLSVEAVSIDGNTGQITATRSDTKKPVVIGYLALGQVTNPNGVEHQGSSYYRCGNAAGDLTVNAMGGVGEKLGITHVNGSLWTDPNAGAGGGTGGGAGTGDATPPDGCAIGNGGNTYLKVGFLEGPNVDLATEISELITTQRGYQANTRIITVTDSMLEELVNMKR